MDQVHVIRHKVLIEGQSQRKVAREMGISRLTGREVYIPLVYRPGDLAEVDFFEVLVDEAGHRRKAWLFLLRLMYSGRDFAWLYHRQDQIAFLDGHIRAFAHLGVPARIAYDNLRPAIVRILAGADRQLTTRFAALASPYLFGPCFCRPAIVPFDPARTDVVTASPRSLVRLDGGYYSVPEQWARLDITAHVGAETVEFVGPDRRRIPHARLHFGGKSLDYRHYLRSLSTKPQAVRQVLPDLLEDLGDPFSVVWRQLKAVHGPRDAARLFARILGQLERHGASVVVPALLAALVDRLTHHAEIIRLEGESYRHREAELTQKKRRTSP
jgi:hypothetical protein